MTANEKAIAMLQMQLVEAKETIGCLEVSKNCGDLIVFMLQDINKIITNLETYQTKQHGNIKNNVSGH
jgi:hypothetical protein